MSSSTERWQAQAKAHLFQPFADNAALQQEGVRVITGGHGCTIIDSTGKRYLDAFAGLWCVNVGYGRQQLVAAAAEQMAQMPYYNLFFKTITPPVAELAEVVTALAPAHINRVFFTNSGSEANDTAFRMARHYWAQQAQPKRDIVIARHNAYHGSTVAGASLGGMGAMHQQGGLPIAGIEHIQQPYWFDEGGTMSPEEFGLKAAQALETRLLELGPERVAAFIAEPIQGAGGVIIPPRTYWPEIQRIVRKYGILLIMDEVICGFGRTGAWFGSDTYGLEPDMMSIAKGLSSGYAPIGGVLISDAIAEVLSHGDFNHGFTYSGHPVSAAVALANIKILQDENWVSRVHNDQGPAFGRHLAKLATHPMVGEVRHQGLLGAVELVAHAKTRQRFTPVGFAGSLCRDIALQEGLVLRATGDTLLFAPPFIITEHEMAVMTDITMRAMDRAWQQLRVEL